MSCLLLILKRIQLNRIPKDDFYEVNINKLHSFSLFYIFPHFYIHMLHKLFITTSLSHAHSLPLSLTDSHTHSHNINICHYFLQGNSIICLEIDVGGKRPQKILKLYFVQGECFLSITTQNIPDNCCFNLKYFPLELLGVVEFCFPLS